MCTSRKSAVKPREIVSNVISKMTRKEVVRDKIWDKCLANAVDFYSLKEPDDRCHKLADATWKTKMSYKRLQLKKDSRMSILIDQTPDPTTLEMSSVRSTTSSWVPVPRPGGAETHVRGTMRCDDGFGQAMLLQSRVWTVL